MKTNRSELAKKRIDNMLNPEREVRIANETNQKDKRIKVSDLSQEQIDTLNDYYKQLVVNNYSNASLENYIRILKDLALFLKKPFQETTKQDLIDFFVKLNGVKPSTEITYKAIIKKFFRCLENKKREDNNEELLEEKEYPAIVKWIKTTRKESQEKIPEDLLTEKEILKIVKACDNSRDKALVMALYESAGRVTEILTLKIKHFVPDQYGGTITITESKTKPRKIRLINAIPHLIKWINEHPFGNNPENYLFINLASNGYGERLGWAGCYRKLQTINKRAGINKKIYPHLFRHSRLTELAKDFTESELKVIAGWSGDSKMAKTYVHLSGGDIEKKLLIKHGLLTKKEEHKEEILKPILCPRCDRENPAEAKYCNCGQVLDLKEAQELLTRNEQSEKHISNFMEENPVQQLFKMMYKLQKQMEELKS